MPRLSSPQTKLARWFALAVAVVTLSVALAVWFYPSSPSLETQASPLRPWFLVEGVNISWDVHRRSDGAWRNATVEIVVMNVTQEQVTFRVRDGDSAYDQPMSMSEAFDTFTTLGALLRSLDSQGIVILDYHAEIGLLELPVGRVAGLTETVMYRDAYGGRVTSQRLLELPNLLLVQDEATIFVEVGGSTLEWYQVRTVIRVDGIDLLLPRSVSTDSLEMTSEEVTFYLFNGDAFAARLKGGAVVVELESGEPSILATVTRRDVFVSIANIAPSLSDLLWPLNDTHALLGMRLEPGRHRLTFEIADGFSSTPRIAVDPLRRRVEPD